MMSESGPRYEVRTFFVFGDFDTLPQTIASQCNALAAGGYRVISTERVDGRDGTVAVVVFFERQDDVQPQRYVSSARQAIAKSA